MLSFCFDGFIVCSKTFMNIFVIVISLVTTYKLKCIGSVWNDGHLARYDVLRTSVPGQRRTC